MRRLAPFFLLLLLAACGPGAVQTDVTRFTSLPPTGGARSFTILPQDGQVGSLEFERYADLVANQLAGLGWQPLPANRSASTVVLVHWGMGAPVTSTWSEPAWGWGGWGPGPWGGGFYSGFPYQDVYTQTEWPKWLEVTILDGPAWRAGTRQAIWQGRAVAQGPAPSIAPVIPYLVRGLFSGFPGLNGETVRVEVPRKQ